MRKVLKIVGIIAGALVGVVVFALVAAYLISEARLNKTYSIDPDTITISTDPAVVEEGRRLAAIRGCSDCHGADLGGAVMIDDPMIGTIYASNLTAGAGGVGQYYEPPDYVHAIRHGIASSGHGLIIMPSSEYFVLGDEDVAALVAYITSIPPVDREIPDPAIAPMGRLLFTLGQLPPLAAEVIDHDAPRPEAPDKEVSVEFGAYLATSCIGCHGPDCAGGDVPGAPPDAPKAANLTPAGRPGDWNQAQFIQTMRTGVTPEGNVLDPSVMPWPIATAMTDIELQALWLYVKNLEPVE